MGIKKVIGMNLFDADVFKVLNWNVPLFIFLIIFIVVALICLGLFIFFVAKKPNATISNMGLLMSKN
jgi:hypothetical protein